jgi:hypothetical protein
MPKLTLAVNANRKWKLNEENIQKACKLLKIKQPIHITTCGKSTRLGGDYFGCKTNFRFQHIFSEPTHLIRIQPHYSVAGAGSVLWHELVHAKQCEVDFDLDNKAWDKAYDDVSNGGGGRNPSASKKQSKLYKENVYEVEARSYEKRNEKTPLCAPRRKYKKRVNKTQILKATPLRVEALQYLVDTGCFTRLERNYAVAVSRLADHGLVEKDTRNEYSDYGFGAMVEVNYWAITEAGEAWLEAACI